MSLRKLSSRERQPIIVQQRMLPVTHRTCDSITTVGLVLVMVSTGLNLSMLQIPLTTGSILRRNVLRLVSVPYCVPISVSQVGLKKSAQGRTTSARCSVNAAVIRESDKRDVQRNGESKDMAKDMQTLSFRQLMA